MMICNRKL